MKFNFLRFAFAFVLAAAVWGYFLDLECLLNRCDHTRVTSATHGQCASPVILPDGASPPVVLPEFALPPALADLVAWAAPIPQVAAYSRLHPPPEFLFSREASSRRGPPLSALS
ncbi:MAG: hypothetical protein KF760_09230 [Candidatus Eremiobacteraeota bacterium]|nr:hypothetical protein [Candidatus Eremiobacteraeota bacterium]MCW5869403.1 hypothetical protein [Candidatus Eremiobacteraeota bacterium]